MSLSLPKISITIEDDEHSSQGSLGILSIGFALQQAWMYAAMFGGASTFSTSSLPSLPGMPEGSITYVFLVFAAMFCATFLFAAATDQKLLRYYTARRVMTTFVLLTTLGTLLIFGSGAPGAAGLAATIGAGVLTGIGAAGLLLFWGVAYSRCDATTIVVNAAVAIVIAMAIYSLVLHVVPAPFSGLLTACLPLLELPLLWKRTPVSYAVRHAVPIFNPLPVKKGPFGVRFGLPILLFGFALGSMRAISTQVIMPSADVVTQLLALFAGGAASIIVLIATFSIDKRSHWDFLFRPLIPLIVVTMFFIPSLLAGEAMVPALILLAGYMCFEALMWIFFGELCQEFRLSPIFVFGLGNGCLTLGALLGQFAMVNAPALDSVSPFGEMGGVALLMFVMVAAYSLLPRVRDIKLIIAPTHGGLDNDIAGFNRRAEELKASAAYQQHEAQVLRETQVAALEDAGLATSAATVTSVLNTANAGYGSGGARSEGAKGDAGATGTGGDQQAQRSGRFRMQCEAIADRYLLSRRETEVMFLLARGHNAAYIQDKLCISRSTAKTHISHIYRKLDIHNQQELLAMVDESREDDEGF